MNQKVTVENYNPEWPDIFVKIRNLIWPKVSDFALAIEHVGSTSVPGLAAKPIIDIDIIIPEMSFLDLTISRLAILGYAHRGNLGIQDREAFRSQNPSPIHKHNLYVCPKNSISLRNHLCLRDTLKNNESLREEYGRLKQELALKYPDSIDDYIEGKTQFILGILRSHGFGPDYLESIRLANLAPAGKQR